jgi:hypothetical protein
MAWLAVLAVAVPAAERNPPVGRPVSAQEADREIERIFEQGRAVNRLQAELTTTKRGGRIKADQPLVQYESVRLAAPNRMWLENRGAAARPLPPEECSIMIVDGENLWDVQSAERDGRRDASRRALREDVKTGGAADIAAVMLLFLGIDRDVRTAGELRRYYAIDCFEEDVPPGAPARPGRTHHFILKPLGEPDGEVVELWHQPGLTLPWKVATSQKQEIKWPRPKPGEPKRFTTEYTVRELRQVRTNREGLAEFPPEAFRLPLSRGMEVVDEETGRVMPHDEVRRLMDDAARRR